MPKLNFDVALERLNDERRVTASEVTTRALRRVVWVAEWHIPGCLPESFTVCASKADAIDCACSMAENKDGAPRGMRTALRKSGRFDSASPIFGACVNTIEAHRLADLL